MVNTDGYNECVVAFLDILGFKNLVQDSNFDRVFEIFKTISSRENISAEMGLRAENCKFDIQYIECFKETIVYTMSDSIVIASPLDNVYSVYVVIDLCEIIQSKLLGLDKPVFLRGAITSGDIYIRDNIAFGKGLVDAYYYQENYAIYPRIIVNSGLMPSGEFNRLNLLEDDDKYLYINTLKKYIDCNSYHDILQNERYMKLDEYINDILGGYADTRVRDKYIWMRKKIDKYVAELELRDTGTFNADKLL